MTEPMDAERGKLTDNDLRTLANSVIAAWERDHKDQPGCGDPDALTVTALARGVLSLLGPADDGEPWDADWLRTVGFDRLPWDGERDREEMGGYWTLCRGNLAVRFYPSGPVWYFNHRDIPAPITRGAVRRLLAALTPEVPRG